ncbi:hypothetical protein DL98DRAFT_419528, partial [Cadophora sp. DSE1049]
LVSIKNILFFAVTASAAVIIPRADVNATATADIKTIRTDIQALTSASNSYSGGLTNALKVQDAYSTLDKAIQSATTDANSFSQQDTYTSRYIISQIEAAEPDVKAAVDAIIAKKSQFTADGVASLVKSDIANLKKDSDALADACK